MGNVVGVTVRIKDGGPHLRGIVVDEAHLDHVVRKFQHLSTKGEDPEVQLLALGHALTAEMKVQPVRAAALLEAGWAARAGLTNSNKHRLRAEGVTLQALRENTSAVRFGDKRLLAQVLKLTGPELHEKGAALTDETWADAAAAALVACSI